MYGLSCRANVQSQTDLESCEDTQCHSDTEHRTTTTESECYDGDIETESCLSASSSSATDGSNLCGFTDPANYADRSLTDQDKYELLTSSVNLPRVYRFPVTAGRKFNPSWLFSRPWLHYSMKNDSLYCRSCLCFGSSMSAFVSTGFRNWKKALGRKHSYIEQHKRSECHKSAEEKVAIFLHTRQPGTDIASLLSEQAAQQQSRMKKGILSIIDIVLTLGQRGIPFRGNWDKQERAEDGNFAYFVHWKAQYHEDLKIHIANAPKNAIYTSPKVQNEIIELCESTIRERIVLNISQYWSLIADETQDCSSTEQLSICIRYVNYLGEVREDFMGFVKLERMDAQTISETLLSTVQKWGLDLTYLVAQGYDGAAVMSSSMNGVQSKIREKYPNATYVHCRSHVLNLAIASGCRNVPSVRNLFDVVEKLTWFLSGSAKRKQLFLESAATSGAQGQQLLDLLTEDDEGDSTRAIREGSTRKVISGFCATRWTARVSTLSTLLAKYVTVLKTLEKIRDHSVGDARSDSSSYIRLMEDSQFIVALITAQFVLSFLRGVTLTLQSPECNLVDAYADVTLARECIRDCRSEESWERLWKKAMELASTLGLSIEKPRTARVQTHRSNTGSVDQSSSTYYQLNVFYPFIDHVINELETRFSHDHEGLVAVQHLVPFSLKDLSEDQLKSIQDYYGNFLTVGEREDLVMDITKWKKKYENVAMADKPKTVSVALSECSSQTFQVLHKLLIIYLATPVGSVSCERSFSALRRLKLWTRSSMKEERLSGLAMMLVHRGTDYIPNPIDIYDKKANWRHLLK